MLEIDYNSDRFTIIRHSRSLMILTRLLNNIFQREMKEESGADLSLEHLDQAGVLLFEFVGDPQIWEVHIFRTTQYTGDIIETEGKKLCTIEPCLHRGV